MNQEERNKLYVAHCLIDGKMLVREAAEILALSERQVLRIKKGVLKYGDAFVIHKNRGRKPLHAISEEEKLKIKELKVTKYSSANFSHFQELLEEKENINLSKASVYRILSSQGIESPKKHRKKTIHKRRKRKPQEGMLVLIDASPHTWIFDSKPFTLHGAIDDATGRILALFFTDNECLDGYFEVIRQIVLRHGVPLAVYADRHSIFRSPKADRLSTEDELNGIRVKDTQFGRAMKELGINLIYAQSPQAKGRIERLWETLQSRLPVELDIAGIKTIEGANLFLEKFIDEFNKRFAVPPQVPESAFRMLDEKLDVDNILCSKISRKVDSGTAFSFDGSFYEIVADDKKRPVIPPPRAAITVLQSPRMSVRVEYNGSIYDVKKLDEPPEKETKKVKAKSVRQPNKPSENHPWRLKNQCALPSFYDDSDREILEALYSSRLAWR